MSYSGLNTEKKLYGAAIKVALENVGLAERVKDLELENLSLKVANRVNRWIERPYTCSEKEDIEMFSKEITEFIISEIKK